MRPASDGRFRFYPDFDRLLRNRVTATFPTDSAEDPKIEEHMKRILPPTRGGFAKSYSIAPVIASSRTTRASAGTASATSTKLLLFRQFRG